MVRPGRSMILAALVVAACVSPNKSQSTGGDRRDDAATADGPAAAGSGDAPVVGAGADAPSGAGADAPSGAGTDLGGQGLPADGGADAASATPDAAPACTGGSTRCAASGPVVEVCGPDGLWGFKTTCPSICAAGACSGECMPGIRRCGGAAGLDAESCDPTGHWMTMMICPNICTNGDCGGTCKPGDKRCGPAMLPEVCGSDGQWKTSGACCDGATQPCANNCGKNGVRTCKNGVYGVCSSADTACCDGDQQACANNCGTSGSRTCSNGKFGPARSRISPVARASSRPAPPIASSEGPGCAAGPAPSGPARSRTAPAATARPRPARTSAAIRA
jgi:hypothetical protein